MSELSENESLARRGIETIPCDCCQWPMPYEVVNMSLICPCCGYEPGCDDVEVWRQHWNGQWWFSEEQPPAIVQRLLSEVGVIARLKALVIEERRRHREKNHGGDWISDNRCIVCQRLDIV